SGLAVEYALALIYSGESGRREATLGVHVGQGTQDLGFRGETPILFDIRPAVPVRLTVRDVDGKPTTGRFTFRDAAGHVFPPQPASPAAITTATPPASLTTPGRPRASSTATSSARSRARASTSAASSPGAPALTSGGNSSRPRSTNSASRSRS